MERESRRILKVAHWATGWTFPNNESGVKTAAGRLLRQHNKLMNQYDHLNYRGSLVDLGESMIKHRNFWGGALYIANHSYWLERDSIKRGDVLGTDSFNFHRQFAHEISSQVDKNREIFTDLLTKAQKYEDSGEYKKAFIEYRALINLAGFYGLLGQNGIKRSDPFALVPKKILILKKYE